MISSQELSRLWHAHAAMQRGGGAHHDRALKRPATINRRSATDARETVAYAKWLSRDVGYKEGATLGQAQQTDFLALKGRNRPQQ